MRGRSIGLIIGLLALMLLCGWGLSLLPGGRGNDTPGSVYNTNETGVAALSDWVKELGYKVDVLEFEEWTLSEQQHILVIAEPLSAIAPGDVVATLEWVRNTGGSLVVVDNSANSFYAHYGIEIEEEKVPVPAQLPGQQPLANPPTKHIEPLQRFLPFYDLNNANALVVYGVEDRPIVVAIAEGAGLVYLVSTLEVFSNEAWTKPANGSFVLNVINRHPEGSTVVFDEIHHGRNIPPRAPRPRTTFSPLVAAMIYATLVIGVWAWFSGRRFGSPMPMFTTAQTRSSGEYIQSMAGLFQRAQQTGYMLNHYKQAFKRRLAKPYGVNPRLDDQAYMQELQRYVSLDQERLAALLNALSTQNPNQESLRRIIGIADAYIQEVEDRR